MVHFRIWTVCWSVVLPGPVLAALPPQHQRMAEFRAIVSESSIASRFGTTPIDRIERIEPNLYRVAAGACSLNVTIVPDPKWKPASPWAGARKFVLAMEQVVCR